MRFLVSLALLATLAGCRAQAGGPPTVDVKVVAKGNVVRYPQEKRSPAPEVVGDLLVGSGAIGPRPAGSAQVVNFWASWCGPCRKEQPILERLHREYESKGVRFVGVNTRRDQRAAALAFLEEFSVTYPSVYDPASRNAFRYRLFFMPGTFVVDRQGRIAAVIAGGIPSEQALRDVLEDVT